MIAATLQSLDPSVIGERLRIAREAKQITQKDAAAGIQVARTTLLAIEQGQRRVRIDEIQSLARLYGTSVNELLRHEAVHVDLVPRFRKLPNSSDPAAEAAAQLLSDLTRAEVELEALLGIERRRNYPPERPLRAGDVRVQAEQDALELRQRLGLGVAPVTDMVTLLEMELGIRVYVRPLESRISGVFAYDDAIGACILLNARHSKGRRNQTAGHELGHFISARNRPEVLHRDEGEMSREERYAGVFGRCFVTPSGAVRQKFQEVVAGSARLTRRHLIVLAHFFGVSREAIARRLEELKLVKTGMWQWFQDEGGITDDQVRQVLGDLATPSANSEDQMRPTTLRLSLLAAAAYGQGLLSEGQLARLLHLDRVELRRMFQDLEMLDDDVNAPPLLL